MLTTNVQVAMLTRRAINSEYQLYILHITIKILSKIASDSQIRKSHNIYSMSGAEQKAKKENKK